MINNCLSKTLKKVIKHLNHLLIIRQIIDNAGENDSSGLTSEHYHAVKCNEQQADK